jgi:3-oxoacyl-[acyl-carrier-protein] synthase III
MTHQNIIINSVEIYHPETKVDNEFFMNHFSQFNLDPSGFLTEMGRKKRYLDINRNENSLSMAIKACQNAIKVTRVDVTDLDMIVFVSDTPEFLIPTNALIIKEAINATSAQVVYDHNANCIGMISAIDHISHYMKSNRRIQKALVVGSLHSGTMANEECLLSYPTFGDGSCAIILEKMEEHQKRGVLDTVYSTVSHYTDKMVFPSNGLSNLILETDNSKDHKLVWEGHDVRFFIDVWEELLVKLLAENNLSTDHIKKYFFSQISARNLEDIVSRLNLDPHSVPFVGDKYGYTGCTSPFFAYYEFLKNKTNVPANDRIIFCSVGAGYTMSAMLYKH